MPKLFLSYLTSFFSKLPRPPVKKIFIVAICTLTFIASVMYLVARTPQMHDLYLRDKVGSRVYLIKAEPNGGGGTGFQVKAPSGTNYIMTNSHICDYISSVDSDENQGTVLVMDDDGNYVRRHIVAVSDKTDLCLVEGVPGVEGLSLGDEPRKGDILTAVGHPYLRPLSLSSGEMIGAEDVRIQKFVISIDNPLLSMFTETHPDQPCNMPKNEIENVEIPSDMGGGSASICVDVTKDAYMTSIVIYPGNSGSPVVDYMGRVVGVAFSVDPADNYGSVVSLGDVMTFISHY